MSGSETHMTKPMTDGCWPPSSCTELLFIRISITIDQWPRAFRKDGRKTMGKEMFPRSRILFLIHLTISTFLPSPLPSIPIVSCRIDGLFPDIHHIQKKLSQRNNINFVFLLSVKFLKFRRVWLIFMRIYSCIMKFSTINGTKIQR